MRFNSLSIFLFVVAMALSGCGGGGGDDSSTSVGLVNISGKITYDLVPVNSDHIGLDYNNITQKTVKGTQVDAIDSSNQSIASTTTDTSGNYSFNLPSNTQVKIRVYAKLFKTDVPSWDVKVVDNTNNDALYVMEGALASTGVSDSTRNLNASSGWGGSSYTSSRVAAPFALLDSVYSAIQKVLSANSNTVFPSLLVNWSVNNVAISGDKTIGQITTSHYTDSNLYILGDEDSDTDEYDDHVVTHEWGHYYEDKFSRSDNIGGQHSGEELLDIRVAFGEGWGNAFSGMALDNPIYFDTLDVAQSSGFYFDVESGTSTSNGWYSESSIERILYDLYDNADDGNDILSLGFAPIHAIFTGAEKTTPAFTSIFTFITALKSENAGDTGEIDSIVSSEDISEITDIYGTGRTNRASAYPYHDYLTLGSSLPIEISNADGTYNKLSNRQYVKFTVASSGTYTIKVEQTNGTNSDPDFYLFDTSPFSMIKFSESTDAGLEQTSVSLTTGDYLLDISDYANIADAQLTVTIN